MITVTIYILIALVVTPLLLNLLIFLTNPSEDKRPWIVEVIQSDAIVFSEEIVGFDSARAKAIHYQETFSKTGTPTRAIARLAGGEDMEADEVTDSNGITHCVSQN